MKLLLNSREGAPAKIVLDERELEISLAEVTSNAKSAGRLHLVELKAIATRGLCGCRPG